MATTSDSHGGFDAVLARWERPLLNYTARYAGSWEAAQDVVQDAWMKFCAERRSAPAAGNGTASWLFSVCRNRAIDLRRRADRQKSWTESGGDARMAATPDAGTLVESAEVSARLLDAVESLPDRQREAVILRFACGLRYRDIAEVMATNTSNVGVLLHGALKTLRETLPAELAF